MFSIKGKELLVSKQSSLLGDGTLNYKLGPTFCGADGKLKDSYYNQTFVAQTTFKTVTFSNGLLSLVAANYSGFNSVLVGFANCETFD